MPLIQVPFLGLCCMNSSMNSKKDFESILITLKTILKNKKITYQILAKMMGMSESGVKKVFSGNDCSLGKILKVCEVIEVDLSEVLKFSKESLKKEFKLSRTDEIFFVKHWDYFSVFLNYSLKRKVQNKS